MIYGLYKRIILYRLRKDDISVIRLYKEYKTLNMTWKINMEAELHKGVIDLISGLQGTQKWKRTWDR